MNHFNQSLCMGITLVISSMWSVACSSPVNIVSSTESGGGTSPSSTKSVSPHLALNEVAAAPRASGELNFRTFSQECTTCNQQLFVFLAEPEVSLSVYSAFLTTMKGLGFAVLGVELPLAADAESDCSQRYGDDPDRFDRCLTLARNSIAVGENGPDKDIGLVNTIDQAVQKVASQNDGWQNFLDADRKLAWSQTIISGSGRSAGIALSIAQKRKVFRYCGFHGPTDITGKAQAPSWVRSNFETPARRLFFMTHKHDSGKESLSRMGSALKKWGANPAPHSWTRPEGQLLFASLQGESCPDTSKCLIQDPIPVDGDNKPIYREAWKYLCTAPK